MPTSKTGNSRRPRLEDHNPAVQILKEREKKDMESKVNAANSTHQEASEHSHMHVNPQAQAHIHADKINSTTASENISIDGNETAFGATSASTSASTSTSTSASESKEDVVLHKSKESTEKVEHESTTSSSAEKRESSKAKKRKLPLLPNIQLPLVKLPTVSQLLEMSTMGAAVGAELLKNKFPKSFNLAEKVVDNWVKDGNFSELPIETPLVQYYVGEGLRKAKSIEKKVESRLDDSGVLPIVKHQLNRAQKYLKK